MLVFSAIVAIRFIVRAAIDADGIDSIVCRNVFCSEFETIIVSRTVYNGIVSSRSEPRGGGGKDRDTW